LVSEECARTVASADTLVFCTLLPQGHHARNVAAGALRGTVLMLAAAAVVAGAVIAAVVVKKVS
jgi:hypothetical protein